MKHIPLLSSVAAAVLAVGSAVLPASAVKAAEGYDIDCKLILCMAGGFPTT
ncbi:hypothetical protein [Acuticoccus sediminis]|uniref:hypothetical protein n=1 Tax=Acuticoccus sediminis TaxID=2184697 RepID=UPI001CFCC17F|nr:hypothetical protein [Acuticoccus sediminis]